MDIFGYSFFVSFILAPLPGLLVSFLKRFNEEKASEWSLSFLIILDTLLCALGKCQSKSWRSWTRRMTVHFQLSIRIQIQRPATFDLTLILFSVSFQMCIEDSSLANAISLCFVFSIVRTFFFIGKGWFYLEFFPKEHFGALYLISNIPAGVANFVVDPIYDGNGYAIKIIVKMHPTLM